MQSVKNAIAGFAGLNPQKRDQQLPLRTSYPVNADHVLSSLTAFISTLDIAGTWNTVSQGKNKFFDQIRATNFVTWVSETVHVQDQVGLLKAIDDCRAHQTETIAEFRVIDRFENCNAPEWVEIKCAPLENSDVILTILRDISERKSLENQLHRSRELADQSNAAKTRFLANMSHELRTPLNAIIGFSDILKSGMVPLSDTDKQLEYQGLINDSAHHLLHVLNDILDMSKIEAGKYDIHPEEIDLAPIVHSTCSMLMPLAQKTGVSLDLSGVEQPVLMDADSKAVRQVIINLVSNAIKFTEPDTRVIITARRLGRRIELNIRDHGKGISPECLDSLGNPFYQIDNDKSRHHEGTGLGLSIVKGLLELHDAKIDIQSEVGVGTNVRVLFPRSHGAGVPVPADDADTIIRIRPQNQENRISPAARSRLAG